MNPLITRLPPLYRRCLTCGVLDCEGTHVLSDATEMRSTPVFACIECHVEVTGPLARAGMPCPCCDAYIVDLTEHIRVLAKSYDPVEQLLAQPQLINHR